MSDGEPSGPSPTSTLWFRILWSAILNHPTTQGHSGSPHHTPYSCGFSRGDSFRIPARSLQDVFSDYSQNKRICHSNFSGAEDIVFFWGKPRIKIILKLIYPDFLNTVHLQTRKGSQKEEIRKRRLKRARIKFLKRMPPMLAFLKNFHGHSGAVGSTIGRQTCTNQRVLRCFYVI